MLIELTEEQVTEHWNLISDVITASAPPNMDTRGNYQTDILESLLLGKMKAWVVSDKKGMHMIGLTGITIDEVLQQRNLIIYSIYSFGSASDETLTKALDDLKKFAVAQKCSAIIGFANIPQVVALARKFGMDTSVTLIRMEV